ncbi:head-tail adaptor protein [Dinoroseobacter sp. PD6]|uniref:head-tail adaptor protein n=1 Tax=Dinoroseobacter sp. PD6 TaxID=3028384 RepID=UPI00237A8EE2|nr:head-tail adaptor protein [Dinoroseobacter sp. PD6]MDD9716577.1 head-tail adaptor protein [Dinoroseobacter sp. PD6]
MTPVLSRKLILEERVQVPDGAGGFQESWEARGMLWADVRMRSGRETSRRPAVAVSMTSSRITVRAAPFGSPSRPKPDQRFREGNRTFRILAVGEADHDARFLTCFVDEEVPG